MKAANKEVRKFVYDKLNGQITSGSTVIPVTSSPQKNTGNVYIQLGNIRCSDGNSKTSYLVRNEIDIVLIGLYPDEATNYNQIEEITDNVFEKLIGIEDETENFDIIWVHFINSVESMELTDTGRVISNIITIELLTEEK